MWTNWDLYWENPTSYVRHQRYTGPILSCSVVAEIWEGWCGETKWSRLMRRAGELGAVVHYWCGVPRSHSAIPLTFGLYHYGASFTGSRLKDLTACIAYLETYHNENK